MTFRHYSESFSLDFDRVDLDICLDGTVYAICNGASILVTPAGSKISHSSLKLMRMLVTELQLAGSMDRHSSLSTLLFCYWTDVLSGGDDALCLNWDELMGSDPFAMIKSGAKPVSSGGIDPDDLLPLFSFQSLGYALSEVNTFTSRILGETGFESDEGNTFNGIIRLAYERLSMPEKAAVHFLSSEHDAGLVLPVLLIYRAINVQEYAGFILSLGRSRTSTFSSVVAGGSTAVTFADRSREKPVAVRQLSELISSGEGELLEFKSTLRWDLKAGKTNQAVERASLKTIAAFLNSAGGTLLIGIRDDGSAEGIESDRFPNEDKFLLHLWTLIRTCLGRDVSPFIRTSLEKHEDKTVCIVECTGSGRPVFLTQPGFSEEMYIRVGPSSNALDISEALNYIDHRF